MTKEEIKEQIDELIKPNGRLKAVDFNPLLKTIVDESADASEINVNTTTVVNGVSSRVFYQTSNGKVGQSENFSWDNTQRALQLGGVNGGTLKLLSKGGLESDTSIEVLDSTKTYNTFELSQERLKFKSTNAETRYVEITDRNSPSMLMSNSPSSFAKIFSTWRAPFNWHFKNSLTIERFTGNDGNAGSSNVNFVNILSSYHNQGNRGRNGYYWWIGPQPNADYTNLEQSHKMAYLSYEKTLFIYNTNVANDDSFESCTNETNASMLFSRDGELRVRSSDGNIQKIFTSIKPALDKVANTGDSDTDDLIAALKEIILATGLGKIS